jgi:DNA-binding NarL/FixJ family response regulator
MLVVSPDEAWTAFVVQLVRGFATQTTDDLACLPTNYFDIIVLDASLTTQVAQAVRQILDKAQFQQSKVIVVAADPSWQEARAALLAGASDYMSKSYHEGDLLNTLNEVIIGNS